MHGHMPRHISPAIASTVTVETENIVKGIMAFFVISLEDLAGWKNSLKSFEPVDIDVASRRRHVNNLLGLISSPSCTLVVHEV
jgi:hypothetical protein